MAAIGDANSEEQIYFEKQTRFLCGVHSLNNLLGKAEFTVTELDGFAKTAGTGSIVGYYDVNTLQLAVASRGYELSYFDSRKNIAELPLDDISLAGFLINTTTPLLFFWKSRHWKAVRRVVSDDGTSCRFYLMDSKAKKPVELNATALRTMLDDEKKSGSQILILRAQVIEREEDIPVV